MGTVVQVQNQRGKDPLRWDRSGIVVEDLGNQQYTVKMDGSGRVSLRNRKFLRKIEPFLPRHATLDRVLVNEKVRDAKGGEEEVGSSMPENQVIDEIVDDDQQQRKSTRVRRAPDRYEAD